ncbi:MAG: protein kinase, partial [Myxococcota bacterium]
MGETAKRDSASKKKNQQDERVGTILQGRYRIIERLAAGGMGVVYRGERLKLERTVAIKFLHATFANDADAMARFEREAVVMGKLNHPGCVSVIDFGFDDAPYVVMDFITGRNLKQLLNDEGRLSPARALHITSQILAALAHAHKIGLVHRDIKPANVMLTNVEGTVDHVYVLDFGLAKFSTGGLNNDITASYVVVGTPAYMSPEQARGKDLSEASDIYSTGVLLFELLTGSKLYHGESPVETLQMHLTAPIPSLRSRAPDGQFSSELEALVERSLAKSPDARFHSATDFAEALLAVPEAAQMPRSISAELRAQSMSELVAEYGSSVIEILDEESLVPSRRSIPAQPQTDVSPGAALAAAWSEDRDGPSRPPSTMESELPVADEAMAAENGASPVADTMALDSGDVESPALVDPAGDDQGGDVEESVRKTPSTPPDDHPGRHVTGPPIPRRVDPLGSEAITVARIPARDGEDGDRTGQMPPMRHKRRVRNSVQVVRDRLGPVAYALLLIPLLAVGVIWYLVGGSSGDGDGGSDPGAAHADTGAASSGAGTDSDTPDSDPTGSSDEAVAGTTPASDPGDPGDPNGPGAGADTDGGDSAATGDPEGPDETIDPDDPSVSAVNDDKP